jgi:hypothetical protein
MYKISVVLHEDEEVEGDEEEFNIIQCDDKKNPQYAEAVGGEIHCRRCMPRLTLLLME